MLFNTIWMLVSISLLQTINPQVRLRNTQKTRKGPYNLPPALVLLFLLDLQIILRAKNVLVMVKNVSCLICALKSFP